MFLHNISLKACNTFGIDVKAETFSSFSSLETLEELLVHDSVANNGNKMILGGGSNILFTKNFDGVVLKNEIQGIQKVKEDEDFVWLKVGAGEIWQRFVMYCVAKNLGGVENLSLIPGCVGASPMQNIGAYGVEIKDVFDSLTAYHLLDKKIVDFNLNDCEFGYRESVFKHQFKNQFAILNVTFRLAKKPVFNTSYGAIEQELESMGVTDLSVKAISDAVINIRRSKLPDPTVTGNAGSFFKNPTIKTELFDQLRLRFENIPGYAGKEGCTKVAAGWLIEQCGWKGYRHGDAGVHPKQALVLVNYGNANGQAIYDLSTQIKESVHQKFGIELEREVNIL
jgi:UDP-N-acetylmuramate dehydrogenase